MGETKCVCVRERGGREDRESGRDKVCVCVREREGGGKIESGRDKVCEREREGGWKGR